MERIITERLILRNFEETDYLDLYEFLEQRKNDEFESYENITFDNGYKYLKERLNNDEFIAVELRSNHKVIGNIYLGERAYQTKELGYIINKNYQRNHYAYEACFVLIKNEFEKGLHRFYAECDPRNVCSYKLLEKLNFRQEALLKQNIYIKFDQNKQPIWQDSYLYGLLKEDFYGKN